MGKMRFIGRRNSTSTLNSSFNLRRCPFNVKVNLPRVRCGTEGNSVVGSGRTCEGAGFVVVGVAVCVRARVFEDL